MAPTVASGASGKRGTMAERTMIRPLPIKVDGPKGNHCALTCPYYSWGVECQKPGDEWVFDEALQLYYRTASCLAEAKEPDNG